MQGCLQMKVLVSKKFFSFSDDPLSISLKFWSDAVVLNNKIFCFLPPQFGEMSQGMLEVISLLLIDFDDEARG